jgi:PIN domain nuclease of toxin-antitoxin system
MNLLLDTHALLWWLTADGRLSSAARNAIAEANKVFVSSVTAWEMATKQRLGKLPGADPYVSDLPNVVKDEGMDFAPLLFRHGLRAGAYPAPHRDPFDRMLAAQAELEELTLITHDSQFTQFPVHTLW